jgi:hypothetical protein
MAVSVGYPKLARKLNSPETLRAGADVLFATMLQRV